MFYNFSCIELGAPISTGSPRKGKLGGHWGDHGTQLPINSPRRGQLGGLLKGQLGRPGNPDIHRLAMQGTAEACLQPHRPTAQASERGSNRTSERATEQATDGATEHQPSYQPAVRPHRPTVRPDRSHAEKYFAFELHAALLRRLSAHPKPVCAAGACIPVIAIPLRRC